MSGRNRQTRAYSTTAQVNAARFAALYAPMDLLTQGQGTGWTGRVVLPPDASCLCFAWVTSHVSEPPRPIDPT